jgi:hypothetical protein
LTSLISTRSQNLHKKTDCSDGTERIRALGTSGS